MLTHGNVLLAGDAYFFHAEMDPVRPRCTPGLAFYQTLMEKDRSSRMHNQARLRGLVRRHAGEVVVVSSHDLTEFERLTTHRATFQESLPNALA